jgi:hypothetical protein
MHHRSHIGTPTFVKINWLPVEKRVNQIILCHMQRIVQGKAPSYMYSNMVKINQHHHHQTRHSTSNFVIDRVNSAGKSSFNHVAKSLWNGLPNFLINITDIKIFKFQLKLFFFDQMFDNDVNNFVFY